VEVAVLRWPAERARLEQLRASRQPRLIIVEHGAPPVTSDELEDWIRAPADRFELHVRAATLRARATCSPAVVSIDDGVLRVGSRTVVLPPIEARLATVLVERMNAVVGRDVLARRAWPAGPPRERNLLDVHMAKLRRLLAETSIEIRTVHRRGYLLRVTTPERTSAS
jgi:DNA-binding response OmpR family regulator